MELGHWRQSRNQQLLLSLRKSIVDKPPFINGTLQLPESYFSLFYKVAKDGPAARFINLANATPDELEQLTQACEPASFGVKQEHVLDETYRKAGKMDSESFASMLDPSHTDLIKIIRGYLLEGFKSTKGIKTELYKLNIYSKGSFFKPHVDTPRSEKMFGSLVVVFPTSHEGGALLLRHRGREWIFDSGEALAAVNQPTICYVAFFGNIEHEVAQVTSGHRITLTYNLYFDDGGPVSENDAVSDHLIPPHLPNQEAFREAFNALLENPEFMADGGTLAFGSRHVYPIKENLKHIYNVLKGSDALLYQNMRALGFEPVLYVFYEEDNDYEEDDDYEEDENYEDEDYEEDEDTDPPRGALVDGLVNFDGESILDLVQREHGILVHQDVGKICRAFALEDSEPVEWVSPGPLTTYNRQEGAFASYGNEPTLNWDICMIVRIGKAGDRLAYPTAEQVTRVFRQRLRERGRRRS